MNKNYLNNEQYASVNYIHHSPAGIEHKGWANVRGYGTISIGGVENNSITKNSYVWNRIQPLDKPFGVYPPNCQGNCQPVAETTLAWGCPQKKNYDNSVFQQ